MIGDQSLTKGGRGYSFCFCTTSFYGFPQKLSQFKSVHFLPLTDHHLGLPHSPVPPHNLIIMVLEGFPSTVREFLSPVIASPKITDVVFLVGLLAIAGSAVSVASSALKWVYGNFLKGGKNLARWIS